MSSTRSGGMRRGVARKVRIGCGRDLSPDLSLSSPSKSCLNPSLFLATGLPKPHVEDQSCKDRILQPHHRKGQYKQEDRDEDQEWQVLDSHVRAFNRTLTDDTISTTRQ